METKLTKTQVILNYSHADGENPESWVHFTNTNGDESTLTQVTITDEVWRDLGEPNQLTVTIEPGDKLND